MELRQLTKKVLAATMTLSALLNIPQVTQPLIKSVASHPHFSILLGAAITIASLLHQPQVIQVLGLKTEQIKTSTEVVPLATQGTPPQS